MESSGSLDPRKERCFAIARCPASFSSTSRNPGANFNEREAAESNCGNQRIATHGRKWKWLWMCVACPGKERKARSGAPRNKPRREYLDRTSSAARNQFVLPWSLRHSSRPVRNSPARAIRWETSAPNFALRFMLKLICRMIRFVIPSSMNFRNLFHPDPPIRMWHVHHGFRRPVKVIRDEGYLLVQRGEGVA